MVLLEYSIHSKPIEKRYDGVRWVSSGASKYQYTVRDIVRNWQPDWIIGCSDIWYGILAGDLGKRYGCDVLIDAYDNYESYMPWAKPVHWCWRRALRKATALSAAGPQLLELISRGSRTVHRAVIPMAADPQFVPMDQSYCRNRLGLPHSIPLVGYYGSLSPRNRDAESVAQVVERLLQKRIDFRLVVAGRHHDKFSLSSRLNRYVMKLGYLPDGEMPQLINSLDVVLSVNRPTSFGTYSYPVKLYEAMSCGIPIVATKVGGTAWILRNHPESLVPPGDAGAMTEAVERALEEKSTDFSIQSGWEKSASRFVQLIDDAHRYSGEVGGR